jgi:hypothetical protein
MNAATPFLNKLLPKKYGYVPVQRKKEDKITRVKNG